MADYNIYIHSTNDDDGKNASPTTAWSEENKGVSKSSSNTSAWVSKASKTISTAQNPDSLVSSGVSGIAKAVPWVAVAYAGLKLLSSSVDNYWSFTSTATGSYGGSMQWDNIKKGLGMVLQPYSTSLQWAHYTQQERINNQKRQLERELLGDSEINSSTNKGV